MKHSRPCPACGSHDTFIVNGDRPLAGCASCKKAWEPLPEGARIVQGEPFFPFDDPCDNCAFRAGSPESRDKPRWKKTIENLRAGGRFYCHKEVPFEHEFGYAHAAGETVMSFDFPKKPDGSWDEDSMRPCRGYLNAWRAWMKKKFPVATA